ncbi:alpha/beta hydrolase family protein [Fimbriimonas ginsengisoli]|uniref:4-O-methyl-glucuronoyl methylesterase-like domain-containing protein n=1 Tax=Fimbriimonas ginsengisoli Gsoil 348 TaxID=661478 RepID=A0A068NYT0_FIMGI|nr:acetylxylan esterase [Fimbriimonas ginsengisoli]AIE87359.1 hypothetical protein OP10G_3991 [Fimbriimonas ginsengisoli Gsoil 348]
MDARMVNRMLEQRVRDLAAKSPSGSLEERRRTLRKSLGLEPMPPRTELNAQVTGILMRDGYRIDKLRYESRPRVLVTAHLYRPEGEGKWPVILRPHGHWDHKKSARIVQAGAIGLALAGFATLAIDSPGVSWDDNPQNERREMGPHDDWFLSMGMPVLGVYVWDVLRGLDYLETRTELDTTKVGITGASGGGATAMYAFALDDRIAAAVPVVSVASLEMNPNLGCLCNHLPDLMANGDRSDVLGMRAPNGAVMVLAAEVDEEFPIEGHLRTEEKLKRIYRHHRCEHKVRFERFWGGHDYNRRMREAALAFFTEHLRGAKPAPYLPESRPLFDGILNPYPTGTEDPTNPALLVTESHERSTRSFRELLGTALAEPYPEPLNSEPRVMSWRRYGNLLDVRPGAIVAIHDSTVENPKEAGSIVLPIEEVDQRLCIMLGLSMAELFGQLLHTFLPGGPEGWEVAGAGIAGDALTSMIASVRTLVSTPEAPPKLIVAEGPVASLAARFLARYRPDLDVQATHLWTSWREALDQNIRQNAQPNARYLDWV